MALACGGGRSALERGGVLCQCVDHSVDIVALSLDMRLDPVLAQGLAGDRADRDDARGR